MKFLITSIFLLVFVIGRAAVPTLNSFEPTQFDTNLLSIKYRSDWTNEVGVLHPATTNSEVTVTNLNLYETLVMPAKVRLLSLGTNELDVSTNSTWLLSSPTNSASQVILSLSAGKFQGQLLFITSQNSDGAFTLPDLSEQYDTPGAFVDLQGDWIGTTNRGLILQYSAPDWIEMDRADPGNPDGPFPAGESIWTNIVGVIQPIDGQTTNTLQFISGLSDNTNNVAAVIDTVNAWNQSNTNIASTYLLTLRSQNTNILTVNPLWGQITIGRNANQDFATFDNPGDFLYTYRDTSLGDYDRQYLFALTTDPISGAQSWNDEGVRLQKSEHDWFSTDGTDSMSWNTTIEPLTARMTVINTAGTIMNLEPTISSGTAYFFSTSHVLTNGDKLVSVQNFGTEALAINPSGNIMVGLNAEAIWGPLAAEDGLIMINDVSFSGSTFKRTRLISTPDSGFNQWGEIDQQVDSDTGLGNFISRQTWTASEGTNEVSADLLIQSLYSGQSLAFTGDMNGNNGWIISPLIADGSAIARFNSLSTHTTGNLLELANNSTNLYYFEAAPLSPRMHVDDKNGNSVQVGLGAGTGFISSGNGLNLIGASGVIGLSSAAFTPSPASTIDLAASSFPFKNLFMAGDITLNGTTNNVGIFIGSGSPEGVLAKSPGSLYLDMLNGNVYKKSTGSGTTLWLNLDASTSSTTTSYQAVGSGTDYSFAAAPAFEKITFGTSGPSFTITNAGTYQVILKLASFNHNAFDQHFWITNVTDNVVVAGTATQISGQHNAEGGVVPFFFQVTTSGSNRTFDVYGATDDTAYLGNPAIIATNTVLNVIKLY